MAATVHDLGPASLGEGELRACEPVAGRYVLVSCFEGRHFAIDDQCNHAGCLLSGGWVEQHDIVCPCHEYRFDLRTGLNTTSIRLCEDQPVYPIRIVDGRLVVELPEGDGS